MLLCYYLKMVCGVMMMYTGNKGVYGRQMMEGLWVDE